MAGLINEVTIASRGKKQVNNKVIVNGMRNLATKTASIPKPPFASASIGLLQRKCACGGTPGPTGECEACHKRKPQRRLGNLPGLSSIDDPPSSDSEVPPIVREVLRSSGQTLDMETRAFMEPRFGHDFSHVRVHAGPRASESARAVNAQAYTVDRHVVFGASLFQPRTFIGRSLLAHELTHVIQQKHQAGSPGSIEIGAPDDSFEQEADRHAAAVIRGLAPSPVSVKRRSLQRDVGWAQRPGTPGGGPPSPYGGTDAPWGVVIVSADIAADSILLRFGPVGKTGELTLELVKPGAPSHVILSGVTRPAGESTESFNIPQLVAGQFDQLRATWTMDGSNYSSTFPMAIRVLGMFRHSQYNIPVESSCGGPAVPAYITDSACKFVPTTLSSGFVSQVNLNGSGVSVAHGNLVREKFCLGKPGQPDDAAERSFRTTAAFRGACGPLDNTTVANCQTRRDLGCGDRVLIHQNGIKTVTDYCPACCGHNQLDNFTTVAACAGINDLGNFVTIKLP
jgi:Domain of unknown function (DUF4157)